MVDIITSTITLIFDSFGVNVTKTKIYIPIILS